VIMRRLIPAGTGLPQYKPLDIEVESPADEIQHLEAALAASHGESPAVPPPLPAHVQQGAAPESGAA